MMQTFTITASICANLSFIFLWMHLLSFFADVQCLKLTEVDIPSHPVVGSSVVLRCIYDMEKDDIYSVKWYKGGAEFYRYHPKDRPPVQTYNVEGIKIDLKRSNHSVVTLRKVDLSSSGLYRCEVSAEAPAFTTVFKEKEMIAINLPEEGPKITGGRPKYQVGDTVQVNCTSFRSKPAAMLSWTINGGKASKVHLQEFPSVVEDSGLETSVLGLEFQVREQHFQDGEMKLRCTASIAPIYFQSDEESVVGGNQQASVLESKETPSQVRITGGQRSSGGSTSTVVFFMFVLFLSSLR